MNHLGLFPRLSPFPRFAVNPPRRYAAGQNRFGKSNVKAHLALIKNYAPIEPFSMGALYVSNKFPQVYAGAGDGGKSREGFDDRFGEATCLARRNRKRPARPAGVDVGGVPPDMRISNSLAVDRLDFHQPLGDRDQLVLMLLEHPLGLVV